MGLKSNLAASLARLGDSQNSTYQSGMKNARTKPLPEPGIHSCQIVEIDGNEYTDKETGTEYLNIEVTFKVNDGPQAGFTFTKTFWGNSEYDMGSMLDLAACATGQAFAAYPEAVTALGGSENALVNVQITQKAVKGQPGVTRKYINFVS